MARFNRYLIIATCALLVYMPFHIFISQWASSYTGGLDLWKIGKDVVTAILTLVCVAAVLMLRRQTKLYLWLLGLTVAYGVLHIILLLATHQALDTGLLATAYNVRLFCYVLIGYSAALLTVDHPIVTVPKMVKILLIVSTIVCIVGLLQWLLPKDIMTHFGYSLDRGVRPAFFIDDKSDLPRVFSTLRDPNSLGAFLILPITLLASALVRSWKTNRRMLLAGLLLLHGLVLFLTFGRGAWLAVVISLGLVAFYTYKKQVGEFAKKFWPFLLLAAICLVLIIFLLRDQYVVQNVVFHSDEATRQTDSNNLHLQYAQKGAEGTIDQPLGHGPGTAGLVSIHQEKGGLLTENYFIQITYETGLAGLLILLTGMGLILRQLWRTRKDPVVLVLIASFAGLTLMNLLLHTWANEAVAISWFLLAGWSLTRSKKLSKI